MSAPIHPEYVALPKVARDPAKAKALMTEAGQADFEFDLITSDEDWHKNTGDAIAAQLREAGIKVKRTVLPGSTFWNDWTKYPYSTDQLEHASAGRAGLVACLPHRGGLERGGLLQSGTRREAWRGAFHRRRREAQAG